LSTPRIGPTVRKRVESRRGGKKGGRGARENSTKAAVSLGGVAFANAKWKKSKEPRGRGKYQASEKGGDPERHLI